MTQPWIIPVGGFLGAGKTTLILSAARILSARGLKCAAIMNDQAGDLVDSAHAVSQGLTANDVTGGCFCCRFSDLIDKAEELRALSPDVIFIEPVGSCTDLSATILQPLKRDFAHQYRLAPLTVVVNPALDLSDPNIGFLRENQLAEADLIFPRNTDVSAWLDAILSNTLPVATKLLTIDYAQYAAAEAALGWLNYSAKLDLPSALSPSSLIGPFLDHLQQSIPKIVHLKIFDQTPSSYLKAALTSNTGDPSLEGDLTASPESHHEIRLNLRAIVDPAPLRALFENALATVPGQKSSENLQCFSPSPPKPEHRYAEIVA
jgi:hypothetical protein